MIRIRNTRRRFLKSAFVAGTMSPLAMNIARPVLAAGEDKPRVVFVYMPDGVYCPKNNSTGESTNEGAWHPTGDKNNPTLNIMTEVLAPIKEHITFFQGLDMNGGGGSHQGGARKVLTGNGDNSLDYRAYVDYYQWLSPFSDGAREYIKNNVRKLLKLS